jgi:DNA helicase HerA-like ATPase
MCGQSRSGKTFALGVILERILLSENAPRVIVIDPNSDFVRLTDFRTKKEHDATRHAALADEAFTSLAQRYEQVQPRIRVLRPKGPNPLKIRLSDLSRYEQGAVLQLHPINDLREFNSFAGVIEQLGDHLYSWQVIEGELVRELVNKQSTSSVDLALRIQNLAVSTWDVWCQTEEPSITQELRNEDWDFMVIDVGTLPSAEQRAVANLAVLNYVWTTKRRDRPVLLVMDEAHNVCPLQPSTPMEEIATDYVIRIAGEGLKYGLRLLLASQRPGKIHPNVLTQCENLVLMRMNSKADLEGLSPIFSQVDPALIAQARYFVQGESLLVGEIVKTPTFAKFEGRLTHEGGADAPAV